MRTYLAMRGQSFAHAFRGLRILLSTQPNARIHAAATLLAAAAGSCARLSTTHWCLLAFAMAAVWIAEAFNTALERACDAITPDYHPMIRSAKDLAAAAVLLTALLAAAVGAIVLIPPLWRAFGPAA